MTIQTSPQDLKSILGIKLKRKLLLALATKDFLPDKASKREELLKKYQKHILPLEEVEWYGLTLPEALEKLKAMETVPEEKVPLKLKFRNEFVEQLKEKAVENPSPTPSSRPWASLNPFRFNKSI